MLYGFVAQHRPLPQSQVYTYEMGLPVNKIAAAVSMGVLMKRNTKTAKNKREERKQRLWAMRVRDDIEQTLGYKFGNLRLLSTAVTFPKVKTAKASTLGPKGVKTDERTELIKKGIE
ncbi:hypothetical protein KIPB_008397, partial [Kipferlia bialata]|eukprot:g8397.t1